MRRILITLTIITLTFFSVSARTYESFINVVGVDNHGRGIMGNVTVEIQPGKGRVLVDTKPLQGIYTQNSERIAVKVASEQTGFDFSDYDIIYSIVTSNAHVIDGPSAGGALALSTIAAIEGKEMSRNLAMTGTIEEDGSIGQVGEVLVKAQAATEHDITVFLIPEGQSIQNQYVRRVRVPQPGWYIETIEPIPVNVTEYAEEKWGMNVYEVSDIDEVMEYAFGVIPERKERDLEPLEDNITLPSFTSPIQDYNDFSWMVSDELTRAEDRYEKVSRRVENSEIPEDTKQALRRLMENSKKYLERAKEIEGQGYAYSSANEAFKSIITTNVVGDLIDYYHSGESNDFLDEKMEEIKNEINETKEEVIEKTNKMICDPENFEWAVAARQRITYAENRINSISGQITPIEVFYKINTAREWVEISKNFMKKTAHKTAGTGCLEKFKERAESVVKEADNQLLLEQTLGYEGIEDVMWYLDAAKTNLERGWYITSIYDATSAKIRVNIGSSYVNKNINEIYSDFNQTQTLPQDLIGTIYLENSYYNIYRGVKDNSRSEAILAMQTLTLSEETNDIYLEIKEKMGQPSFDWSIDWKFDFDFDISQEDYVNILLVVVIALVFYLIFLSGRVRRLEKRLRIGKKGRNKGI